jgi:thioredoxin-related protein
MNRQTRFVIGLLLGLLCFGCGRREKSEQAPEKSTAERADWLTDFASAQAQARAEDKMLLISFTGSDWCPPCIMLHRQVFSQPEFAGYAAKHLVLLEVDFPHTKAQSDAEKVANQKLADRFGIYGFPTVIVLDSSGKKIGELGYMRGGPRVFIAALEKLRTKS